MMKQTMHKSTTAAIWLAAVAVIALVAKPTSAWAQNPKTFTEYVNEIIETQQEQDEPEGERVFFTPYLTNDTHYMVISDISINTLYNVCEGAFCVMDNKPPHGVVGRWGVSVWAELEAPRTVRHPPDVL